MSEARRDCTLAGLLKAVCGHMEAQAYGKVERYRVVVVDNGGAEDPQVHTEVMGMDTNEEMVS